MSVGDISVIWRAHFIAASTCTSCIGRDGCVEFLLTLGRYKVFPLKNELNDLENQDA
jgi:hypothetical protein